MSDDIVKKEPDKDIVVARKNWIDSLKDNSNTVYSRLTDDEKKVVDKAYRRWKDGFYSSVPMICQNDNCPTPFRLSCPYYQVGKAPLGEQCHPPGTKIKTAGHEDVNIEVLDPDVHSLVGWSRKQNSVKHGKSTKNGKNKGLKFNIQNTQYDDILVKLTTTSQKAHKVTLNHISIVRFNENAINKFCVYLMKRGDFYRIGKSTIMKEFGGKSLHKLRLPFVSRAIKEDADALWILGIYNTNTEALLAEEYFSVLSQTPKACFLAVDSQNWNGLYRWVTQEQLDDHFRSLLRPHIHYAIFLKSLDLDIDYPIWQKDGFNDPTMTPLTRHSFYIRSCNILDQIMSVPVFPDKLRIKKTPTRSYYQGEWEQISISKEYYSGPVYSLDVDKYSTYYAGDIATHNCPVELDLMIHHIEKYAEEFNLNPEVHSELILLTELAECIIYEDRATKILASPEANQFLLVEDRFTNAGDVFTQTGLHPVMIVKDKMKARRMKILESLLGTRKEKARVIKTIMNTGNDYTGRIGSLKAKIEELNNKMNAKDEEMEIKE